ncbi:MAG: spore coat associated protein CotJA [Clostridiaceae bacterium]|nr:spore coat associated protein CotJA [Clostridiaceae bacterium]
MHMNPQCPCEPCMPMPKLAHAYVPFQCMTCIYPPLKGLYAGTIFPELDRPYGEDPEYLLDA